MAVRDKEWDELLSLLSPRGSHVLSERGEVRVLSPEIHSNVRREKLSQEIIQLQHK